MAASALTMPEDGKFLSLTLYAQRRRDWCRRNNIVLGFISSVQGTTWTCSAWFPKLQGGHVREYLAERPELSGEAWEGEYSIFRRGRR